MPLPALLALALPHDFETVITVIASEVKAALAMFDAYDKNNDDVLDAEGLHLLFRDFACAEKAIASFGSTS